MIQRILYVGLITGFCILGDVTAQNTSNESIPYGETGKNGENKMMAPIAIPSFRLITVT